MQSVVMSVFLHRSERKYCHFVISFSSAWNPKVNFTSLKIKLDFFIPTQVLGRISTNPTAIKWIRFQRSFHMYRDSSTGASRCVCSCSWLGKLHRRGQLTLALLSQYVTRWVHHNGTEFMVAGFIFILLYNFCGRYKLKFYFKKWSWHWYLVKNARYK